MSMNMKKEREREDGNRQYAREMEEHGNRNVPIRSEYLASASFILFENVVSIAASCFSLVSRLEWNTEKFVKGFVSA
jgi:hypothetical protein